jgi:predicted O-methyltransferase YrrM
MARREVPDAARPKLETSPQQYEGQLDNRELEELVSSIVGRWRGRRRRTVVEIGTGGGQGSTVAIHRALTASNCPFELVGYEGNPELAHHAARYWSATQAVRIVNEYFSRREDIELAVKPRITPSDRDTYLPHFEAVAAADNFLVTPPPGPIDLLFIDSVRYTHLAILRAAVPWLQPETIILMEDDIPGYGELAIVKSEFTLRRVSRHEAGQNLWPLVEFRIAKRAGSLARARRLLTR